jgi:photosynthetic reaction center cytochrome c subunit
MPKPLGLVLAALSLTSTPALWPQNVPPAASSVPGGPAEKVYKNIQVLKGVPFEQLIPSMQFISASLGVECGFCHVQNHFESDEKKPKQTARKMIQMMMAINQSHFDNHQAVTCNTCHHGMSRPLSVPSVSEGPARLRPPASSEEQLAPNLPNPQQVIAKYVDALGGSKAIEALKTLVEKGQAEFGGGQVPVEIVTDSPDKRILTIHLPAGDSITAVNNNEGWLAAPRRPVQIMSSGELEGAKLQADLQLPVHLMKTFADLHAAPPEKIGDRDCYVLVGETAGQPRARFYFDQQSGLLVRMVQYAATPLGLNPTRIDYFDYRPVQGVQVPFRWTVARPAGQFSVQIAEASPNVEVGAEIFVRPAH